jgi:hypothetical protein
MFSCSRFAHAQFGVLTSTPMDREHDIARFIVNID